MTNFARVDFGNTDVSPELRSAWQGKIVALDYGTAWSLGGRPTEGIGLGCPDSCLIPLDESDIEIAELLEATFWHRNHYTENLDELRRLPRD